MVRFGFGQAQEGVEELDAGNREGTYADFCSLAATLVAFTCAVARTVVWAATANILTKKGVGVLRDGGCRNGPRPDLPLASSSTGSRSPSVSPDPDTRTERSHWSRPRGETATLTKRFCSERAVPEKGKKNKIVRGSRVSESKTDPEKKAFDALLRTTPVSTLSSSDSKLAHVMHVTFCR